MAALFISALIRHTGESRYPVLYLSCRNVVRHLNVPTFSLQPLAFGLLLKKELKSLKLQVYLNTLFLTGTFQNNIYQEGGMKKNGQKQNNIFRSFLIIAFAFIILPIIMANAPLWAQDKQSDLIITTLFDNDSSDKELKTGWGYSCLLQGTEKTILFDVGSTDVIKNMEKLKINPASIDVLVISHGHFDHTGGMHAFAERNSKAATFYVPSVSVKICENVFTTGAMGTDIKEDSLIIKTAKGLVVITGCAHPGIVEIVQKAKQMFPKDEIYLVMGGFHLIDKDQSSIKNIVGALKKENVRKIAPSHCTGDYAETQFKEAFDADYIPGDVGKPIIIEGAFKKQ
jgi:7,8-dihydropterin-6-yl-methyl-4-(beta-D-ribofuranosyl)aminobenzene 5'-phosphate synthase